jgi:alpha-L-fucosidase
MKELKYIEDFKQLGFGLFVHFGVYSIVGKGEWYLHLNPNAKMSEYEKLPAKFKVKKNWAKELVKTAKQAGCKYITLTTRHHDGFSLYDTCGLNDYDAPHSACGRDLIREFVDACNEGGIVPFFYHTLLDWREESYKTDFPKYIDYLVKSIETLCKNYGKIGGFWFDGMWDKKDEDWQEDRIYGTIRKYLPEAMIINNTGLSECGKVGHPEIDSVTFERGEPGFVDNSDKCRAGEMCQVLNDHWGYAAGDCNYKPIKELLENLVDCRSYNCNFLLNTGLRGDGSVNPMDACMLKEIGKWTKKNKEAIYSVKSCAITAKNATILEGNGCYYAVIKNVPMSADPNVQRNEGKGRVYIDADIRSAEWLDNGEKIKLEGNSFEIEPYLYGESYSLRVAKFTI